jgi:hypothetical protein
MLIRIRIGSESQVKTKFTKTSWLFSLVGYRLLLQPRILYIGLRRYMGYFGLKNLFFQLYILKFLVIKTLGLDPNKVSAKGLSTDGDLDPQH